MRAQILGALTFLAACGGSDEAADPDAPPGGADAGPCAAPLDTRTLDALTHSFWAAPSVEVQPGGQRDINLGTVELGAAFAPVEACATWSIAPTAGASIDPMTGVVQIDAGTAGGTEYVVTANVEAGRKLVTADVFVFVAADMPWHGNWREEAQFECGPGDVEVPPEQMLNEVYFWADGTLWVTWTPFEVYVDYRGTHAFDTGAGTLTIVEGGGNYVPPDIDGTGTFMFGGGDLVLRDMWLGSPQGATMPARCGHRLTR
jgi:hypothetical protein